MQNSADFCLNTLNYETDFSVIPVKTGIQIFQTKEWSLIPA